MESPKDRLKQFVEFLGIPQFNFETSIGMSNGWVSKPGDTIRESTMRKIREVYPQLNTTWLLTGEGVMLNGAAPVVQQNQNGDNIQGANVKVDKTDSGKLLEVILQQSAQLTKSQEQLSKSQEQIDRLISIIEKK